MMRDYSEQIAFAVRHARRYYPMVFRRWPEDARQAATLGALVATESTYACVAREAGRAIRRLLSDLLGPLERSRGDIVRRRSSRAKRLWTAQRLRAIGLGPLETAEQTGLTVSTVNRYTRSGRDAAEG